MDWKGLKEADAALGIDDPAAAVEALNAQTVTEPSDIPTADARSVLLLSGEWFRVKQLAKTQLDGSPRDQAVAAADICIDALTLTTTLHTSDPAVWADMQPMIAALSAAGVISTRSIDVWAALRMRTRPLWPELTVGDIQTARAIGS